MKIRLEEVKSKNDLKRFVEYPFHLYRDSPNWVPPLKRDEYEVFSSKNPASAHSQFRLWLAYKDNRIVGRIAGVVLDFEREEEQLIRFGWIDFEDDIEITRALISAVEDWALELNLKGIHGPLGFSDMDFEGMLIEGFETPATIATIYNYEYYPEHLEKLGFDKSVDWVEGRGLVPSETSRRLVRIAQLVESRFGLKSLTLKSRKHAASRGEEMFNVLNKSYENLYGFHKLTPEQIKYYIKQYLGFVIPDMMSMVVNRNDELVGFAVAMPSLTEAFQKAKGRLFPFGFYHILRALKTSTTADLYLIGVLPEYQKMGVTSIIFRDLIGAFGRHGIVSACTNQMLEENQNILTQFGEYQETSELHKRRRCFKKLLT